QPEDPETPEQPEEPEQPKPVLTILSNSILNFGADGTLYEVKYKVENPVEGASVKAVADVEWVTNIVVVDATETITFEVLANDTTKARSAKLWVHYSTILREIEIRQEAGQPAPEPEPEPEPDPTPDPEPEPEPTPDPEPLPDGYDVAYRAACLSGGYIGQEGSAYNYFVILSDVKCSHQRDIEQPNSRFYCLDVYAKSKSDKLPNGTYKIDVNDTFKQGTVAATYSPCVQTDGNGEFIGGMMAYEAGTLTVTDNKIVGEFEMSNGKKHYVIYEGSLMLSYE
ncbi:MAG: BACON domain-containing protein, partial [Alistipes sp.]|nr:BACON domain-containing protein [Alistipes sp.]